MKFNGLLILDFQMTTVCFVFVKLAKISNNSPKMIPRNLTYYTLQVKVASFYSFFTFYDSQTNAYWSKLVIFS
jgi:hypothetical protein